MATQHDVDNKFSNINGAYEATNAKLEELGKMDAKGQVSRVQFLSDVADAYVAGTLNYVTPDKPKGKVSETHHAKHAWNIWNNARAKVLGRADVNPTQGSRVAELAAILKAVQCRADIVSAARNVAAELTKDTAESAEPFKGKTYELIVKAARAQNALSDKHGKIGISNAEIRAAYLEKKDPATEEERAGTIKKALEKMAEDFGANSDIYVAAAAGMDRVLTELKSRREKAERRAAYEAARAEFEAEDAEVVEVLQITSQAA